MKLQVCYQCHKGITKKHPGIEYEVCGYKHIVHKECYAKLPLSLIKDFNERYERGF